MILEGPSSEVCYSSQLILFLSYLPAFVLQVSPPNPEPVEVVDANFDLDLALPFDDHLAQEETLTVTPLFTKRIRRPTERALDMFDDNRPGILESDDYSMTADSPPERQPSHPLFAFAFDVL
jgi:hypothetical protein